MKRNAQTSLAMAIWLVFYPHSVLYIVSPQD